jgi:hypothetical protein
MHRTARSFLTTCLMVSAGVLLAACSFGETSSSPEAQSTPASAATPDTNLTAADWKPVQDALGNPGTLMPGGVFRIGMPRTDLKVTLNGVAIQPGFALGSYAAFVRHGSQTMAVGDLVLLEDEVAGVASSLLQSGIEVTAVHNHLLGETPHILYMHFQAQGNAVAIAQQLHAALASTGTPFGAQPPASPSPPAIDGAALDQVLGRQGKVNGSIYSVSVGRGEPIVLGSVAMPAATGVATVINFESTGDGLAAVTGDFALLPAEVEPVISTLRANGIEVTALHSHMLMDAPHLLYVHFYAHADPMTLARGLRAALDKTDSVK